jgi:hypothetical protein
MEHYLGWLAACVIGLWLGSFLKPYMSKKAENLATHEDIQKLVEQMTAVTQATKEIEAKISQEVWERQRQSEMRKEAVFSVMQALLRADDALVTYSVACDSGGRVRSPEERRELARIAAGDWYDSIQDFDRKRAMALLVCEGPMNDALLAIRNILRSGARQIGDGERRYSDLKSELEPAFAKIYALGRHELGIIRRLSKKP